MATHSDAPAPLEADPRKDSLIEFPSLFPIKVMGAKVDGFVATMVAIALLELRESRAGNYLGVTLTVTATSREQLDDLYRALSGHPLVKIVL